MVLATSEGAHMTCGRHSEERAENMHARQPGVLRSESTGAALGVDLDLQGAQHHRSIW